MLFLRKLMLSCILLFSLCEFCIGLTCNAKKDANKDFDTLMFVQQWPVTFCMNWMSGGNGNECKPSFPKGTWTIHGIWPNRFSTKLDQQPACCDNSLYFSLLSLLPMKDQLKRNWPSVRKDKPDEEFWEQEWLKHGTCGAVLDELNTSNKYLSKALDWLKEYNMTTILAKSNIVPDNDEPYKLTDIHAAITSVLNKNPSSTCYIDRTTNEQYLSEIRICFNKQLDLVDCDGINSNSRQSGYKKGELITNCLQKMINYRSDLPHQTSSWLTVVIVFGLIIILVLVVVWVKRRRNSTLSAFIQLY